MNRWLASWGGLSAAALVALGVWSVGRGIRERWRRLLLTEADRIAADVLARKPASRGLRRFWRRLVLYSVRGIAEEVRD